MSKIDPIARAQQMRDRGTEPQIPYPGADKPWPGVCHARGHVTLSSYSSVVTKGQGPCKTCAQINNSRKAAEKRRVEPEVAVANILRANVEPLEPFSGTQSTWRCRCNDCGREIDVWYSSVVYAGNGACSHCSSSAPIPPDEAWDEMLTLGLEPLVPYPGVNEPWRSRCPTCTKIVDPSLTNARKTKYKCRFCARRATDPNTATEIMKAVGLEPLEPFPGNVTTPWRAKHLACGRIVSPTLDKVTQRRRAPCSSCAQHGFQPDRPSYIYLIIHAGLAAGKIGIYNENSGRLRAHQLNGWTLIAQELLPGHLAAKAEVLILDLWTGLDLPLGATKDDMPQGGWTETVALVDRSIANLLNDFTTAVDSCR
ncbi:hypothetical protein [Kitasatospora sp. NPDC057015]|uniref:hypothetical protein n=1 Tax=Kitasatospora sp. NPDC057015 TaxID=3346001 RepID=UPI0036382610